MTKNPILDDLRKRERDCSLRQGVRWKGWWPNCSGTNIDPIESLYTRKAEQTDAPEPRSRASGQ